VVIGLVTLVHFDKALTTKTHEYFIVSQTYKERGEDFDLDKKAPQVGSLIVHMHRSPAQPRIIHRARLSQRPCSEQ
jgi:hypothetical protein